MTTQRTTSRNLPTLPISSYDATTGVATYPKAEWCAEHAKLVLTTCTVTRSLYGYERIVVDEAATMTNARRLYDKLARKAGFRSGYPGDREREAMRGIIEERAIALEEEANR